MIGAMHRRGPDGRGSWARDGIALGHARLSIIDVSDAGAQPMVDRTTGVVLVFNGEIYNYIELRSLLVGLGHQFCSTSDSEVLLRAYIQWGRSAFTRCVGMWALAIFDPRVNELILSRDRFGIKPLYFHRSIRGNLAFASTIGGLTGARNIERRPNLRTVGNFLVNRMVDEDAETFFEGVERFPAAHNAVLSLGLSDAILRFERYWSLDDVISRPASTLSFSAAVAEFQSRLTDSVKLHARSDVEVSSCLSGGLDSSALVGTLAAIPEGKNIRRVFSAVFPNRSYDEGLYSRLVAEQNNLNRYTVEPDENSFIADIDRVVEAQEEPFGSTGVYVQWKVFEAIHNAGIKVALDGQGADEYLAGYFSFLAPFAVNCLARGNLAGAYRAYRTYQTGNKFNHHIWRNMSALMMRLFNRRVGIRSSPFNQYLAPSLQQLLIIQSEGGGRNFAGGAGIKPVLARYLDRYSMPALLRYEDRNSMYFSVESRVPFLDHRLVEFALTLPSDYLLDGKSTKRVMRAGLQGIVPEAVRNRTDKIGFGNPESEWVTALSKSTAFEDLLQSKGSADLVDVVRVRSALAGQSGVARDANFVWRLFSLLAWQRWAFN